jgi:hypothetical protein
MIIARGTLAEGGEGDLLVLGLSRVNVGRLVSGQPIKVTRETHGDGIPANWTIIIYYGETEQAMADELKQLGLVGPETRIHRDPRL